MHEELISDDVWYTGYPDWSEIVESAYLEDVVGALAAGGVLSDRTGVLILAFKSYIGDKALTDIAVLDEVLDRRSRWIVIYVSDEGGDIPHRLCGRCEVVFKAYLPDAKLPSNLFHFPVGVANYENVPDEASGAEKDINVFFSGNLNEQRFGLHKQLSGSLLPEALYRRYVQWNGTPRLDLSDRFPDSVIRFSRDWSGGMDPAAYHRTLGRSKIALCPAGFRTPETFRHFEALRAGCVVISEPLPQSNPFYETEAVVQVESYGEMVRRAEDLLQDRSRLQTLLETAEQWWETKCSPRAVAGYMTARATECIHGTKK